jgi:hypothetical protein
VAFGPREYNLSIPNKFMLTGCKILMRFDKTEKEISSSGFSSVSIGAHQVWPFWGKTTTVLQMETDNIAFIEHITKT